MTALRLRCCVPFCNRTRGQRKGEDPIREGEEWICHEHWRAVPRKMKAFKRRAKAKWKRAVGRRDALTGMDDPNYEPVMAELFAAKVRSKWIWQRCKRAAIERAMGIR